MGSAQVINGFCTHYQWGYTSDQWGLHTSSMGSTQVIKGRRARNKLSVYVYLLKLFAQYCLGLRLLQLLNSVVCGVKFVAELTKSRISRNRYCRGLYEFSNGFLRAEIDYFGNGKRFCQPTLDAEHISNATVRMSCCQPHIVILQCPHLARQHSTTLEPRRNQLTSLSAINHRTTAIMFVSCHKMW